jgi:hypothetical protein
LCESRTSSPVDDGHPQLALVIGQLGAIDPRLALAAHVDEHVLAGDLDDASLDDLTALKAGACLGAGEQRREILGVSHGALDYTGPVSRVAL